MNLTPKQKEVALFVMRYRNETGIAPTVREIATHLHVARPTVMEHLDHLDLKGAITRESHRARSVQVTKEFLDVFGGGYRRLLSAWNQASPRDRLMFLEFVERKER